MRRNKIKVMDTVSESHERNDASRSAVGTYVQLISESLNSNDEKALPIPRCRGRGINNLERSLGGCGANRCVLVVFAHMVSLYVKLTLDTVRTDFVRSQESAATHLQLSTSATFIPPSSGTRIASLWSRLPKDKCEELR